MRDVKISNCLATFCEVRASNFGINFIFKYRSPLIYMFEQSLYEPETIAEPTAEGDLFHNYEITNWNLGPRIYKILGMSAVANVLVILIVGQTSLLTMKGCESPLVGSVCQVIDTIYVGTKLFGTDREYIDAVYDKTELGDAEVTFVDVTGITPPLSYPEGYFQVANPIEYQALLDAQNSPLNMASIDDLSGFPTTTSPSVSSGGNLFDTPQNLPKQNPDVIDGQLPTFGDGGTVATTPPNRNGRRGNGGRVTTPSKTPKLTPDEDDIAVNQTPTPSPSPAPTVAPTGPIADVELNKRPFVDLGNFVNDLVDKKQVQLDSKFLINATGKLDEKGKLDAKSFRFIKAESADAKMIEVVKEAIEALNESGYLQYLSLLNGKVLSFQIQQDDNNVTALVQTEFENELRPKTIQTLLNAYIDDKKKNKEKPEADQNDKDDLALLQKATVKAVGKKILISFEIPKADAQQMIQRKLAEQKAQPKPQNSTGAVKTGDNAAKQ